MIIIFPVASLSFFMLCLGSSILHFPFLVHIVWEEASRLQGELTLTNSVQPASGLSCKSLLKGLPVDSIINFTLEIPPIY